MAVTAIVAVPLGLHAAQIEAQATLDAKSQLITNMVAPAIHPSAQNNTVRRFRQSGLDIVLIRDGRPDRTGLPREVISDLTTGRVIDSQLIAFNGHSMMINGYPLGAPQDAIVVLQNVETDATRMVWNRLWLALGAGLLAGVTAGFWLARRNGRPISAAAIAARRMSAGDRSVRLSADKPTEIADLSRALNDLAAALATSEGRQREFLLSVSHELRTPLTTIRGYAEALSDGVIDTDDVPGAGRTILSEADRLDRLVSDLLSLARLEAADFQVQLVAVELGSLIAAAAEAWRPRCTDAGLDLRIEPPPQPTIVSTDPGRIRQVVDILISNAVRALPKGAPLVLAVRENTLEVRDGGPGLAEEDLAVAFEQGVLHKKYRDVRQVGSGLGLALASRLVRRMGARIEAGHADEGGARFTIAFSRIPTIFTRHSRLS